MFQCCRTEDDSLIIYNHLIDIIMCFDKHSKSRLFFQFVLAVPIWKQLHPHCVHFCVHVHLHIHVHLCVCMCCSSKAPGPLPLLSVVIFPHGAERYFTPKCLLNPKFTLIWKQFYIPNQIIIVGMRPKLLPDQWFNRTSYINKIWFGRSFKTCLCYYLTLIRFIINI